MSISYAVFCLIPRPPISTLFPYTTLFRSAPPPGGGPMTIHPIPKRTWLAAAIVAMIAAPTSAATLASPPITVGGGGLVECSIVNLAGAAARSEEHTSELQSHVNLVCRLLLDTAPPDIYTLSLHDALPICPAARRRTYDHPSYPKAHVARRRDRRDDCRANFGRDARLAADHRRGRRPGRVLDRQPRRRRGQIGRAHV